MTGPHLQLPKEGGYEDSPLAEIIGVIISPHHRSYTGLCFPNAWDPIRPLKLDDNDEVKLKSLYDTPVECGCDYEIPMLKNLPKPKKNKSADTKTTKNKDNKDKTKVTKTKAKSSSSKSADSSSKQNDKNKHSKPKKDRVP